MEVTVLAHFKAKPGKEGILKDELLALIGPTHCEEGCINYDLHQSAEDAALLMLYENWTSKKDLDDHLAMPYLQEFLGKADDLLAEPVSIALYQMISTPASR